MQRLEGLVAQAEAREFFGQRLLGEDHIRLPRAAQIRNAAIAHMHRPRPRLRFAKTADALRLAHPRAAAAILIGRAGGNAPDAVPVAQAVGVVSEADAVQRLQPLQIVIEAVGEHAEGNAVALAPVHQFQRAGVGLHFAQQRFQPRFRQPQPVEKLHVVFPSRELAALIAPPQLRPPLARKALRNGGAHILLRKSPVVIAKYRQPGRIGAIAGRGAHSPHYTRTAAPPPPHLLSGAPPAHLHAAR